MRMWAARGEGRWGPGLLSALAWLLPSLHPSMWPALLAVAGGKGPWDTPFRMPSPCRPGWSLGEAE